MATHLVKLSDHLLSGIRLEIVHYHLCDHQAPLRWLIGTIDIHRVYHVSVSG